MKGYLKPQPKTKRLNRRKQNDRAGVVYVSVRDSNWTDNNVFNAMDRGYNQGQAKAMGNKKKGLYYLLRPVENEI
jgi:hypothetical protein